MACLIVSLYCPLFTSQKKKTLIKDVHARKTYHCSPVLNTSTCLTTGINISAPKLCEKDPLSLKRHHNRADSVAVAVFVDCKIVYTPRVIYGFWVGPENEDGCGFVEAIVN